MGWSCAWVNKPRTRPAPRIGRLHPIARVTGKIASAIVSRYHLSSPLRRQACYSPYRRVIPEQSCYLLRLAIRSWISGVRINCIA